MFPPAGFDSSFEFAAKTTLLDMEASSLVLREEHPYTPPERGRLRPFSSGGQNSLAHDTNRGKRAWILMLTGQCDQYRPQRAQQESTIPPASETLGLFHFVRPSQS
jgi:hypothetical protein